MAAPGVTLESPVRTRVAYLEESVEVPEMEGGDCIEEPDSLEEENLAIQRELYSSLTQTTSAASGKYSRSKILVMEAVLRNRNRRNHNFLLLLNRNRNKNETQKMR
jgi:hypothetical protein